MYDANRSRLFRLDQPSTLLLRRRADIPIVLALSVVLALPCRAQSANDARSTAADFDTKEALQELQSQIRELKGMVLELQQQTVSSRAEITRLREELTAERNNSGASSAVDEQSPPYGSPATAQLEQRVDQLEENQQLLSGKIDEQYQTKVESASKYRIRMSGIVLFNLFGNSGSVDNQDVPTWAAEPNPGASSGSVGGTLRQSILGFEAFGPDLWSAHTSASVNFDFGGGFPAVYNGVDSGLVRLRTAAVRLDWENTSLIAGQDQLFLSPDSPTSFASLIVPPLSYAGNLWAWTPQLRVEHRFALSQSSKIAVQGALMDPLTGEPPDYANYTWYRTADAGEQSRQPAYAARVAYSHPMFGQNFTAGLGGYYSRENWGYDRIVDGWAGTADANLPLGTRFALSGFFYRGAAIGGLGGALGRSVLFDGPLSSYNPEVQPVNALGGWAQLKFHATPKMELNGAFGQDSPFASDIRYFGEQSSSYSFAPAYYTANRGAFGNVVYRPRSDLVFAAEYRRLVSVDLWPSRQSFR